MSKYNKNSKNCNGISTGREEEEVPLHERFLGDIIDGYETPNLGWESLQVKKLLASEYITFVTNLANWTTFITLTFKEEKTPDVAKSLFDWFIRVNNAHAFGEHYTKKVGHSYFSYVVGVENQIRDVPHFHLLIDKPVDFSFIHHAWGLRCGFAWIDTKFKDREKVVKYLCKYITKGGQVDCYKAKKDYTPAVIPAWWVGGNVSTSRVDQVPLFSPGQLAQPLTCVKRDNDSLS